MSYKITRYCSTLILLLLLCFTLSAQDSSTLSLKGDVTVVKVDKVVVVKEDRTLVKSLPFKVEAPTGGILYQWKYPNNVTAISKANVLEVKNAPKGPLQISVEYAVVIADFDAKKIEVLQKYGQIEFDVGETRPNPVPPPPDPVPVSPLTKRFMDQFDKDTEHNKKEMLRSLESIMRDAAVFVHANKTNLQFTKIVKKTVDTKVGEGKLTNLRREIGKYLGEKLPEEETDLTESLKEKLTNEYLKVADALKEIQ